MDLGIRGKTALVAASSKGLGRAAAMSLAHEGVKVVITARGSDALEATADAIRADGGEVLPVAMDVTDPASPGALVDAAVDRFGSIDILVPNAGGPPPGRALELDDDQISAAVNANLLTTIRFIRSAVPAMRGHGWGRICVIASATVKQPIPGLAASNLARTGLWAWAKTAAADLFPDGITLNLACPGLHLTDRVKELGGASDSQPIGDPADFGDVVAFLCSEQAGFISGAALQVDGARTTGLL